MHIQLDPVGGVAGDMFAAAVLDAWPELEPPLVAALARAGLDAIATVERIDHADDALTGSRFAVHETSGGDGGSHAHGGNGHRHGEASPRTSIISTATSAPCSKAPISTPASGPGPSTCSRDSPRRSPRCTACPSTT